MYQQVVISKKSFSQIHRILHKRNTFCTATLTTCTKKSTEDANVSNFYPKPYDSIPGPRQLPFIGNSWRFAPIIGQYKIQELDKVMQSLKRDFGKIVKIGGLIGHPDLLFVFDGNIIEKVFKQEEVMPHRPSMPSLHYYKRCLHKDFFDGNAGIIGVHGSDWEKFRKEVQKILLEPEAAKMFIEPLNNIADDFIHLMEMSLENNKELPDTFLFEIYKWALESVARVSLDIRLGCLEPNVPKNSESQQIINAINTFFWNVAEVELKLPIWRIYQTRSFKKYIAALDNFKNLCMKNIEKTIQSMESDNQFNENKNKASVMQRILLKTGNSKLAAVLALDLLLVGIDTTSVAVASTMYQLSQNMDIQEKLFQELSALLPSSKSKIDVNVQQNLNYLRACIKETLRMYPVIIGNGRNLTSDTIIGDYKVPKGTHIIFPHLVVSNEEEYFKEPEKFIPERWLKTNSENVHFKNTAKIHPFVSLPFGYGRRSCLGRRFAEMELQIVLAKIFRMYQVHYEYEPITYKITPTYVPAQPLKFKLIQRNE